MSQERKAGRLYIVATPIGNLKDLTFRACEILRQVSLIAAEDTRRARILLEAYDIKTPTTSLHEHNEYKKGPHLIGLLEKGRDIACISNAGTPGISDPGFLLVAMARERDLPVIPIPGASAVVAVLSVSGLPADKFIFDGFLPSTSPKRRLYLSSLKGEGRPVVVYESPHRLRRTLKDIGEILPESKIIICREVTKIYEEFLRGRAVDLEKTLEKQRIKGEITIVIPPQFESSGIKKKTGDEIRVLFKEMESRSDLSRRDLITLVAREHGLPRKEVYEAVIRPGQGELSS